MDWYDTDGDVDLGGGLKMHKVLEGGAAIGFGNDALYTPAAGGPAVELPGTLEQSTHRPDELTEALGMPLSGQVFRVRRAVKSAGDFPRSTSTDSMFYGTLVVAGTSYNIASVHDDQSFVYLTLATAV